ncbi:MAG: hypothetical protein LV479_11035 [Methylacidiphilales bacterium]|nr:hypothetical protein [Candidatus Methylacidiphilales bacterium]
MVIIRRVLLFITGFILLAGMETAAPGRTAGNDVSLYGPTFPVGDLKFTIPSRWKTEPTESPARAGQWHIPIPHAEDGEGAEAVVFYFGAGVGGSAQDNIGAWNATMLDPNGQPATADVQHHDTGGLKISEVTLLGTYNQPVTTPGLPPQPHANYGLFGAVIESPQGNIYWRITGPAPLITANLPLFRKIIESVRPQDK